jgi:O-antigen/teichoic acid export membrane protein
MTLREQSTSGVRWTGLGTAISAVVQLLQLWALTRLLDPADFGVMGMALIVVGLAQTFTDFGLSNAIIQKPDISEDELSSLYWINWLAGIAVFLVIVASTPLLVGLFDEPRLRPVLRWMSVVFLIIPAGQQFRALLQKELRFRRLVGIEITATVSGALVVIGLALAGWGVMSLVAGQITSAAVLSLLLLGAGWRRHSPRFRLRPGEVRGLLSFGVYQTGERALNFFAGRVDQIVIARVLGATVLGYYTLAFSLVIAPIVMINGVVTRVAFPVFSMIQLDVLRLNRAYPRLIRVLNHVNAPLLAGIAVTAPVLVPLLYGAKWVPAIILIQILAAVAWFRSIGNPTGSLLLATGRAQLSFLWTLLLFITTPVGVILGVRWGGAPGAALGLLAVQFVFWVPHYRLLVVPTAGRCAKAYLAAVLEPLALAAVMAAAVLALGTLQLAPAVIACLQISGGILIYTMLFRFFDRDFFTEMLAVLRIPRIGA